MDNQEAQYRTNYENNILIMREINRILFLERMKPIMAEVAKIENTEPLNTVLRIMRNNYGWQMFFDMGKVKSEIDAGQLKAEIEVTSYFTKYGKVKPESAFKADLKKVCKELGIKAGE